MAVEAGVKFIPLMVSVKAAPPEAAELGLRLVSIGAAAHAAGAHAHARAARKATVNHLRNERALCI